MDKQPTMPPSLVIPRDSIPAVQPSQLHSGSTSEKYWLLSGGRSLSKPTHFEENEGEY